MFIYTHTHAHNAYIYIFVYMGMLRATVCTGDGMEGHQCGRLLALPVVEHT